MASSRLEKVGTIYSRVRGLLRSGALNEEDKPIWYDVYTAFPPKYEPKYDRPAPDVPLRNIFYPEDTIRAKFHKEHKSLPAVNLSDRKIQTQTQKFISAYNKLREDDEVPKENLYQAAADLMNAVAYSAADAPRAESDSVASSFKEAGMDTGVNIKEIFKD